MRHNRWRGQTFIDCTIKEPSNGLARSNVTTQRKLLATKAIYHFVALNSLSKLNLRKTTKYRIAREIVQAFQAWVGFKMRDATAVRSVIIL